MNNDWIIEVLADMEKFSAMQEFSELQEAIQNALIVAAGTIEVSRPEMLEPILEKLVMH